MLQISSEIVFGMSQYANDNNGNYPDGKSSTEVFQKMLDGGYVSDPSIFYVPMAGKTKAVAGQLLKPENVCFDVTSAADRSALDGLPIVFSTGYKVNYVPGGVAVPLVKPYPKYEVPDPRSWWEKLRGWPVPAYVIPGIAGCYKSGRVSYMPLEPPTT